MPLSAAEKTKKWRNSEKGKVKIKKWKDENKEIIAAYNKQWREDNLDHCKGVEKSYCSQPRVKEARRKNTAKYRATEKGQTTSKVYRELNKEKISAKTRQWQLDNKESEKKRLRESHLKHSYGITQKEYECMVEKQEGKCAICNEPPCTYHGLVIDHDHCIIQLNVRGLICQPCNAGLGKFNDDPSLLEEALKYLRNHQ